MLRISLSGPPNRRIQPERYAKFCPNIVDKIKEKEENIRKRGYVMIENNNWIINILNKNVSLIGFADLTEIDKNLCYGFRYGVSIAIALKVFPSITNEPSRGYYNEYKEVSKLLRETSNFIAEKINEKGFSAYSLANEKQNKQFRTKLPFKTLATRAGLGWIGKSATLVTKNFGNAIRLNGVLTEMPFKTGKPIIRSFCGNCTECVKYCPGKAIIGNSWNINIDRDNLLNAHECKKAVIERGKMWNVTEGTCGICLAVCPYTKEYIKKYMEKKRM
jgi:epoxyqueuosine reductase QueG